MKECVKRKERESTKQGLKKSVGEEKKTLSRVRRERGCKTKIENSVKRKKKGLQYKDLKRVGTEEEKDCKKGRRKKRRCKTKT